MQTRQAMLPKAGFMECYAKTAYTVHSRSREIIYICLCLPQILACHVITGSFLLQLREEEGSWKTVLHRGSSASSKIWLVVSVLPW